MLPPDVDGIEASKRSFDFSKFPNLQEVGFEVGWVGGDLLWIPTALSTLGPATSPRLSAILLRFASSYSTNRSIGTLLNDAGSDLRRVAGEFARIKREFKGAVNLTVFLDPAFKAVLDTLRVRFRGMNATPRAYWFIPCRSFSITFVEMGSVGTHLFRLVVQSPTPPVSSPGG